MSYRFLTYRVGSPSRLSTGPGATELAVQSRNARFDTDGFGVVFETLASLTDGDGNGAFDIYRRDLLTGEISRLSTNWLGESGSGASLNLRQGPNGSFVFDSASFNFLPFGDLNNARDVFFRSAAGEISIVSQTAAGVLGNGESFAGVISPDGGSVLFESLSTNLVGADTNDTRDLFLKSLANGGLVRLSTSASGAQANGQSGGGSFSPDGGRVLFESNASNLVSSDTNASYDLFIRDLESGLVTRVSPTFSGAEANGHSFRASFTEDGMGVLFESEASNLVANDTNGVRDIFLKDLTTGAVMRVSEGPGGVQLNGQSQNASIVGRRVVFETNASNAIPGDSNARRDIYAKDLDTGLLLRISLGGDGAEPNADSYNARLSPDGTRIIYESAASNLVPTDTNGQRDLFLATVDTVVPFGTVRADAEITTGTLFFESDGEIVLPQLLSAAPADALGTLDLDILTDAAGLSAGELRWTYRPHASLARLPGEAEIVERHTITLIDPTGEEAMTELVLTILGVNDAPVTAPDSVRLRAGASLDLATLVLANDRDVDDGDRISIVSAGPAASGAISVDPASGVLTYHADTPMLAALSIGQTLTDSFTYTISDLAGATATATVTIIVDGVRNEWIGTDGDDVLIAYSSYDAVLRGGAGRDRLTGGAANDLLDGGPGADTMGGGNGNDTYLVDAGDVVTEPLFGGLDTVRTALTSYRLPANVEDLVYTGLSSARFTGTGNELGNWITGGAGGDRLSGLGNGDVLFGGAGGDFLDGGTGGDRLDGGAGADTLLGSAGADVFVIRKGESAGDLIADFRSSDGDQLLFDGWSPDTAVTRDALSGATLLFDPEDGFSEVLTIIGDPSPSSFFG